jgi:hypothetical protein
MFHGRQDQQGEVTRLKNFDVCDRALWGVVLDFRILAGRVGLESVKLEFGLLEQGIVGMTVGLSHDRPRSRTRWFSSRMWVTLVVFEADRDSPPFYSVLQLPVLPLRCIVQSYSSQISHWQVSVR